MSIEARLYAHLAAHAGLSALIGDRIYPVQLPQGATLPALTYMRVSTVPVQHRDNQEPTYSTVRFQIDGWTGDYDQGIDVRRQIRAAMGLFKSAAVPRVDVALLSGDRDLLEAEPDRWRCSLDYKVMFQED